MITLFTVLALLFVEDRDVYYLGIGIVSSIVLFILAVKLDKKATEKLFIILDDDMRTILRLLDCEKSFVELQMEYKGSSSLSDNLKVLKKMKLVNEKQNIVGTAIKKSYVRNL